MPIIVYACAFVLTMSLETAVIASLPEPWRLLPLALVFGILILQERSLVLGAVWIALSGVVLEARGLGHGLAFAGLVAASVGVLLATFLFAKKSFWALLGMSIGTAVTYVIARAIWLSLWFGFKHPEGVGYGLFSHSLTMVMLTIFGVVVCGLYLRRLLRFTHDRFVRKGTTYDISFPP